MPPRKSLPARTSTPSATARRGFAQNQKTQTASEPRTRTRPTPESQNNPSRGTKRKRNVRDEGDEEEVVDEGEQGGEEQIEGEGEGAVNEESGIPVMDEEKELDAWLDFAAEHYEMVEQLPLELHRNFRLLKELDDGSISQMEKLHALIREYITRRIDMVKPSTAEVMSGPVQGTHEDSGVEVGGDGDEAISGEHPENVESTAAPMEDQADGVPLSGEEEQSNQEAPTNNDDGTAVEIADQNNAAKEQPVVPENEAETEDQVEVDNLIAVHDSEGGLVAEPTEYIVDVEPRRAFPEQLPEASTGPSSNENSEPSSSRRKHTGGPWELLPEIGRLAREVVRNGEEKVAVAVGAYNSIDRHIRALDSALSAQEASILLGLRPNTNPSDVVDESLNISGNLGMLQPEGDEDELGEVVIGLGGGAGNRKKGRGRGRKKGKIVEEPQKEEPVLFIPPELALDPNEPVYCVCNQVSYGTMVGCDNEDCPIEWFHLPCVGLVEEPSGKWLCPVCRPKTGSGSGATGVAGGSAVKVPAKQRGRKAVPKGAARKKK